MHINEGFCPFRYSFGCVLLFEIIKLTYLLTYYHPGRSPLPRTPFPSDTTAQIKKIEKIIIISLVLTAVCIVEVVFEPNEASLDKYFQMN